MRHSFEQSGSCVYLRFDSVHLPHSKSQQKNFNDMRAHAGPTVSVTRIFALPPTPGLASTLVTSGGQLALTVSCAHRLGAAHAGFGNF